MEIFKPKETDAIGEIKSKVRDFIKTSQCLDDKQKESLIEELSTNWNDERFSKLKIMPLYISIAKDEWMERNQNLVDFWKSIAIENAKINNEPYKVATETVNKLKREFL